MAFYDKISLLNRFVAAGSPEYLLGTDRAYEYSNQKGMVLHIADSSVQRTVSFLAFIKSFKISTVIKMKETEAPFVKVKESERIGITYDISLDVPAMSINDARLNLARLEELNLFMSPLDLESGGDYLGSDDPKYVLLGNLIHNGSYKSKRTISNYKHVRKFGLPCYFNEIDFTPDVSMGFFEFKDRLFPKVYSFKLKLLVKPNFTESDGQQEAKYLALALQENGTHADGDVKTWPFGVL